MPCRPGTILWIGAGAHPLGANLQLLESFLLEEVDAAPFVQDLGCPHGLDHRANYQRESTALDDMIGVVAFVEGDWPLDHGAKIVAKTPSIVCAD